MNTEHVIISINVVVCLTIAWVCICRLNSITPQTMLRVRLKYTMLQTGALSMAGMPILFDVYPNWFTIAVAALVLVLIVLEMPKWRHGPPSCSYRSCREQRQ